MKAVILAGGLGSRLRPCAEIIHKLLLSIGEELVHIIPDVYIMHLK